MSLVNAFEIRQQIKIQDKLEDTVLHILEATKLVSNLAKNMMVCSNNTFDVISIGALIILRTFDLDFRFNRVPFNWM